MWGRFVSGVLVAGYILGCTSTSKLSNTIPSVTVPVDSIEQALVQPDTIAESVGEYKGINDELENLILHQEDVDTAIGNEFYSEVEVRPEDPKISIDTSGNAKKFYLSIADKENGYTYNIKLLRGTRFVNYTSIDIEKMLVSTDSSGKDKKTEKVAIIFDYYGLLGINTDSSKVFGSHGIDFSESFEEKISDKVWASGTDYNSQNPAIAEVLDKMNLNYSEILEFAIAGCKDEAKYRNSIAKLLKEEHEKKAKEEKEAAEKKKREDQLKSIEHLPFH